MTVTQGPDLDNVFEALANLHRREIIYVLSLGPASISKLAFLRHLSLPAIHKHIDVLEKGGMVLRRKIGQTNFLALNRKSLRGLQDWITRFQPYSGNDETALENYAQSLSRDQIKIKEKK